MREFEIARRRQVVTLLMCLSLLIISRLAVAQESAVTIAGEIVVEPATLISLGFEWPIEGDSNRNAVARVWYRRQDERAWHEGLPLLRLQHEQIKYPPFEYITPNMFAGSLFDLQENRSYAVKLQLSDPDGVSGTAERVMTVSTRAEPKPAIGGATYHLYPPGYQGEKQQPAFESLLAAYYTGVFHYDWSNAYPPRVRPGDTILVHAGLYKDTRHQYGRGMGTVFDGTYYLTASGTAEKPIVIKAAGDGEVIFDGDGNHNLFNVMSGNYNYFEGLTIRNTEVAFLAGTKNIAGASGFTLKHSRLEDIGIGVMTDWSGSRNFYIADNVFIGRNESGHLMGWIGKTWEKLPGYPTPLESYFAVKVYGSGHVIAHNFVANFHDGIDHATYGNPDGSPQPIQDRKPVATDIYNNDITNVADNCIETDGAMHNIRVLRNRCFNQAHASLSAQPLYGGPAYFIRNVVYHAPEMGSLKIHSTPAGLVIYHNTFISEVHQMSPASNLHFRNNLILGQGAMPQIFAVDTFTSYSTSDYNGFRPNAAPNAAFGWTSPTGDALSEYDNVRTPRSFNTLAEYVSATGQDKHSVLVDFDVFERVSAPDPSDPTRLYNPKDMSFELRAKSKAVDAGVVLPNVNDGYKGRAPDLGAYETGVAMPVYGPR